MKQTLLLISLFLTSLIYSQKELSSFDIDKFTYYFKIENNTLIGNGVKILKQRISESQFVLLGEQHFASEISIFSNSLLPILADNNFKHFAVEIGPNSANALVAEIHEKGQLYDFNTDYYKLTGEIPIPFFDGKEDETFLKTALNLKFQIWGIDQEYLNAQFFLFKEILKLSADQKKVKKHYQLAYKYMLTEFKKYWADENYKIFENYQKSTEIDAFFKSTDQNNPEVQKIITDLKKSWSIYQSNDNGLYRNSWNGRIGNLKTNFSQYYRKANSNDTLPKVFVKMGAVHLSNGLNDFGYYDIGNLIEELSYFNQTKSTSLKCIPRFYKGENNEIIDDLKSDNPLKLILEKARQNEWTLFSNNELINYCYKEKIKLNSKLKTELKRFDYILIPPIINEMKMNFKEK
ncbi:hypothetical protein [Thalassobellus citreus]|uniref:hypothetical protein n=1 Tax=Thalassobellus citreus TaxID=3367752 RepID=UPI0037B1A3AC